MKSVFVFCIVTLPFICWGQYPVRQNLPLPPIIIQPPYQPSKSYIKIFKDTCQANETLISKYAGAIIAIDCDSLSLYIRNNTCDKWVFLNSMWRRNKN